MKKTKKRKIIKKRLALVITIGCCFLILCGAMLWGMVNFCRQQLFAKESIPMTDLVIPEPTEPIEPTQETTPQPTSVPSGAKQDISYLNDAVFIGDSRTESFIQNLQLTETTSYAHKGLNVNEVFINEFINLNGNLVTVIDALKQTNFSKVYIMLGINETGWIYDDLFIEKYREIVQTIHQINPEAKIYVQSILPVSKKVNDTHRYIHRKKIQNYNKLLRQMAEEEKVTYLNLYDLLADKNGDLPEDAAFDGIHLKKETCETWLDYLLKHTN